MGRDADLPARGMGLVWRLAAALALVVTLLAGWFHAPASAAAALEPFSHFPVPTPNSQPYKIAAGPDGALWFTERSANTIGRMAKDDACTIYVAGCRTTK